MHGQYSALRVVFSGEMSTQSPPSSQHSQEFHSKSLNHNIVWHEFKDYIFDEQKQYEKTYSRTFSLLKSNCQMFNSYSVVLYIMLQQLNSIIWTWEPMVIMIYDIMYIVIYT